MVDLVPVVCSVYFTNASSRWQPLQQTPSSRHVTSRQRATDTPMRLVGIFLQRTSIVPVLRHACSCACCRPCMRSACSDVQCAVSCGNVRSAPSPWRHTTPAPSHCPSCTPSKHPSTHNPYIPPPTCRTSTSFLYTITPCATPWTTCAKSLSRAFLSAAASARGRPKTCMRAASTDLAALQCCG